MKKYESITTKELNRKIKGLSPAEKKDFNSYLDYRKSRGLSSETKQKDVYSGIIRLRVCAGKPLDKLSIDEITNLSSRIRSSDYGDYSKIEAITNLKRFVKWKNPAMNLEDIQLIKNPIRKNEIKTGDLPTKEEVEKLISHEPKMFWKAFLFTQFEAGLRTKEVRFLRWEDIQLNSDEDISEINIFSTKTKTPRDVFVKESTFYLKKLKQEQENLNTKGEYIFHSKRDINKPVSRAVVSMWMSRLTKRVLGRNCHNYLLRHSRGNMLYQLSKQGKISKDIAITFMGHSKEMSSVYTHDNKEEVKRMLKDQVYHIEEMPEEERGELKKEVTDLKKSVSSLKELILRNLGLDSDGKTLPALDNVPDKMKKAVEDYGKEILAV